MTHPSISAPLSQNKMFGGVQATYEHRSEACDCDMKVAVFTPAQFLESSAKTAPVLIWLSGLTCDTTNFQFKAGAQRVAAELGVVLVMPDTSPRGDNVPDTENRYDFGKGAGFYLDATEDPWSKHFNMESYIRDELTAWIKENLPVNMDRMGIFVLMQNQTSATILIDQGTEDQFLTEHLRTDIFTTACEKTGQPADIRMQAGYDHSYFFIATFIEDHLRHHAAAL